MNPNLRFLLEANHGVATRPELIGVGTSRTALQQLIRQGVLVRVTRGIYRWAEAPSGDVRVRVALALAHGGQRATLSHLTAAALWGLRDFPTPDEPIDVTVPHGRHPEPLGGIVVHQRRLLRATHLRGWPVTRPLDTLVDLASVITTRDLRFLVMKGVNDGLVSPRSLASAGPVPRRALRRWALVTEEALAGAWSGGEATYWRLLVESTLPLPRLNVEVDTIDGPFVLDALWPDYGLGAEIDGRKIHTLPEVFDRDRAKSTAAVIHGFPVIRFSVNQVMSQPGLVLARTEAALQRRATELGTALYARRAGRL